MHCGANAWQSHRFKLRCSVCGTIVNRRSVEIQKHAQRGSSDAGYNARVRRKESDTDEAELARQTGGRVQRGSGCGPIHKLDVATREELREHKETRSSDFRFVKLNDWYKTRNHALSQGLRPILDLRFKRRGATPDVQLVVLDLRDYEALKEAARDRSAEDHR